jgi:ATP-binding protein involved in chromosome partitioning
MDKNQLFKKTEIPNIKNIILVASGKGGVGKSTVAAGLAISLALEGYAVGLFDADIYGPSIPTFFKLKDKTPEISEHDGKQEIEALECYGVKIMSIGYFIDNKQPLLWRGPMASNALKQLLNDTGWGKLDYLIIDTPPGTGDIHLTLVQEYKVTGAIIVTTPQNIALSDVQKAVSMFQNENVAVPVLGVIENMSWFSPSKHPEEKYFLFGKGGGEFLSNEFHVPLLAQIPITETLCENCDKGEVTEMLKDEQIRKAYDQLIKNL